MATFRPIASPRVWVQATGTKPRSCWLIKHEQPCNNGTDIKIPIQVHALARRQYVLAAGSSYRRTNSVFGGCSSNSWAPEGTCHKPQRGPLSTTRVSCFSHAKSLTQSSTAKYALDHEGGNFWQLRAAELYVLLYDAANVITVTFLLGHVALGRSFTGW